ncbi:MAG TPA: ABC transporter substrate-binding protein [Longimicrobiaceae bacterium]|nr:ABC transporter substrate-binding protein [Longimicrobiaceae bacterium]
MAGSTWRSALVSLLAISLLGACGGDRQAANGGDDVPEEQKYGGTVTVGAYGDLQTMNSLVTSDYNSANIQREMLFMPLVKYDAQLNPTPWLAERWDTVRVKPDTIELTFHIRRDIKWHDGRPTTARDVLFTFDRAVDPETAFPNASGFDLYEKRGVLVDDYTVKFRLKPHSDFLDAWYQMPSMPEHILGNVPPAQLLNHPFGTQNPVGNGPFRFVRAVSNREWVFEANDSFPEALGGRPYIDRYVWRNIPEMTTLLTELLTGGIDLYLGVRPEQAAQVESNPNTRLSAAPNRQWVYVAWNTRLPQFRDARVRRALSMAIDRRQIVDALLYGHADVGRSTVTPAHWSYDTTDTQTLLPYDTIAARRLLTEAGWIDRNGDGTLEDAQGRPFRFVLKTNQGNDLRKDITEVIQAQLGRIGIRVTPQLVEWNTLTSELQGQGGESTPQNRDYEAVVNSWVDYFRKDDKDILHCTNLEKPYQYVGYCNPRVDHLIDTLGVMTDRTAALPLWQEYQRLMVQEAPYTTIYYPKRLTGVSARLRGWEMDIRGELPNITEWWIDPAQRRAAPARPADTTAQPRDSAKR